MKVEFLDDGSVISEHGMRLNPEALQHLQSRLAIQLEKLSSPRMTDPEPEEPLRTQDPNVSHCKTKQGLAGLDMFCERLGWAYFEFTRTQLEAFTNDLLALARSIPEVADDRRPDAIDMEP